jgi:hypothetical protein
MRKMSAANNPASSPPVPARIARQQAKLEFHFSGFETPFVLGQFFTSHRQQIVVATFPEDRPRLIDVPYHPAIFQTGLENFLDVAPLPVQLNELLAVGQVGWLGELPIQFS